jgi:DNA invertase Pin-like site-specific DNA recombinase
LLSSGGDQTDQSIEGQLRECREFADRNDITIVGIYADHAMTGRNDHRPDFLRMIADSESGKFEAVIVWKLDRFARNRYDSAIYKAKLKKTV